MDIMNFGFNGHQVRTALINNQPHFVLNDLCAVLEISNPRVVVDRLSEDDVCQTDIIDSVGRFQKTNVVNEAGMYEVVLRSDKPEAAAFRRWLTTEVLPELRKTGTYSTRAQPLALIQVGVRIGQPVRELPAVPDTTWVDPRKARWAAIADHARSTPDVWHPVTIDGFAPKQNEEAAKAIRYGHRHAFADKTFTAAIRDGQLYVRHNTPEPLHF